jgi:hypothetical protein
MKKSSRIIFLKHKLDIQSPYPILNFDALFVKTRQEGDEQGHLSGAGYQSSTIRRSLSQGVRVFNYLFNDSLCGRPK